MGGDHHVRRPFGQRVIDDARDFSNTYWSVVEAIGDARRGFEVAARCRAARQPRAGWLDPQKVADAIKDDTLLVSVMLANNEIGVIQPIREIAEICDSRGVPLHCDATQAVGKIPVDVQRARRRSDELHRPQDLWAEGNRGAVRPPQPAAPVRLEPLIDGGGQENGLRSGTLNVPGIVGFAKALELCLAEMPTEIPRLAALRQRLWDGLQREMPDVLLNGPTFESPDPEPRAPSPASPASPATSTAPSRSSTAKPS